MDFVVTEDGKPIWAIECKLSDDAVAKSLRYFKNKFPECEVYQLVYAGKQDFVNGDGVRVMPALLFLQGLK